MSRPETSSWAMTLSAVRSRCSSPESATRVSTSAGENGYTRAKSASAAPCSSLRSASHARVLRLRSAIAAAMAASPAGDEGSRSRRWEISARSAAFSWIRSKRSSHQVNVWPIATRSAPGIESPRKSLRSRCRATNDTIGTARRPMPASTSFATFDPSVCTKVESPRWVASHSTSSSRNSTTAW